MVFTESRLSIILQHIIFKKSLKVKTYMSFEYERNYRQNLDRSISWQICLPFLYIGITLAVLNNDGKYFDLILQLNICTRIGATIAALILKYFAETLSIPVAFPVSRCFRCFFYKLNWDQRNSKFVYMFKLFGIDSSQCCEVRTVWRKCLYILQKCVLTYLLS